MEPAKKLSRRSLLKTSAVAAGAILAGGPAAAGPKPSGGAAIVIDCHAHLHHHGNAKYAEKDRQLIEAADKLGIHRLCCSILTPARPATADGFRVQPLAGRGGGAFLRPRLGLLLRQPRMRQGGGGRNPPLRRRARVHRRQALQRARLHRSGRGDRGRDGDRAGRADSPPCRPCPLPAPRAAQHLRRRPPGRTRAALPRGPADLRMSAAAAIGSGRSRPCATPRTSISTRAEALPTRG